MQYIAVRTQPSSSQSDLGRAILTVEKMSMSKPGQLGIPYLFSIHLGQQVAAMQRAIRWNLELQGYQYNLYHVIWMRNEVAITGLSPNFQTFFNKCCVFLWLLEFFKQGQNFKSNLKAIHMQKTIFRINFFLAKPIWF